MSWLRRWCWVPGLIVGLAACSLEARADPLKSPRRMINGQAVDLAPLFAWWTRHNGERPLTAWVHVTGTIVATNALGWTVRGVAESRPDRPKEADKSAASSHDLFILKNPPVLDQAKFEQLVAAREQVAASLSADKQQLGEVNAQQPRTNRRNQARARELKQEAGNLKQSQTEAEAQLKEINKQLQPYGVSAATGGARPQYKVDCFALDMDQELKGVPLYNHGASFN